MATELATVEQSKKLSLAATVAAQYDMEATTFLNVVRATVFPQDRQASNEQVAAFLAVCQQHGLNPFTREIFAFPTKGGGIQPIVSIDGWIRLTVGHPQYDGMDIKMELDDKGKPLSCTCTIYRKDRKDHATPVTEYYDECYRETDPWKKMPKRMLRHKAIKEAARITFGFAGIMDEDEGLDAIKNITGESVVLERTTNERTETLKDKIGAKKASTKSAAPAQEVKEEPAAASPASVTPPPPPAPPEAPQEQQAPTVQETMFDGPSPETVVSVEDRQALLKILEKKCAGSDQARDTVMQAARKQLFDRGYTKMAEMKYKDYPSMVQWANDLKV